MPFTTPLTSLDISLGSWPDWIAAAGTSLAFLVAAVTWAVSAQDRRRAQARLVYARVTDTQILEGGETFELLPHGARQGNGSPGSSIVVGSSQAIALVPLVRATVVVSNGSAELIGPVRVQMVNSATGQRWKQCSVSVSAVEPGDHYPVQLEWINDVAPGIPMIAPTILFRDASGRWWRRDATEPIELVHSDPENTGIPADERPSVRKYQASVGVPEDRWVQEPKVPIAARFWRLWRRARRKPPLP